MKKYLFIMMTAVLSLSFLPSSMVDAQSLGTTMTQLIKWQFSKTDGTDWTWVSVPHSCNAIDGHSASYYRGKAYYKTNLTLTPAQVAHPLFLLFEGAAQAAQVSVNGRIIAAHKGGYTPFTVSLKGVAQAGNNEIKVMCDNKEDVELIPVSSDFNKNNGLHNPVYLLEMSHVYASPLTNGLYRLHVSTPRVSAAQASTLVATTIVNASNERRTLRVALTLADKKGKICFSTTEMVTIAAGDSINYKRDFTLAQPHLWNGVADPYLYTAQIKVTDGRQVLDVVSTKVGYRFYRMDADKGFFLNGHSYPLRGVSMHQDWNLRASAFDKAYTDRDYDIIHELGANFLRLAHYPHNDYEFRKCDEMGIIVQTEIPWVNVCGVNASQAYFDNIHQQMREMITNLYNHPSICFWGMWNELDGWGNNDKLQGKVDLARIVSETNKLYDYAKSLDPYRLVGMTDCSCFKNAGYKDMKGDYYSENRYDGWYYKKFDDFTKEYTAIHQLMGIINVSEYGCGVNPFCHASDPAMINNKDNARHYEEYGNLLHESHVRQILKMPYINFTSLWIMFDFPVAARQEGYMDSDDGIHFVQNDARKFMNDKGLVTRDRQTKKDAFYLYKSLWNHRLTTVYITGRRLKKHSSDKPLSIKVYSNAKSLTLYQNGKKIQTMNGSGEETKVVWQFRPVNLLTVADTFRVVASDGTSDSVTFNAIHEE